MHLSTYNSPLGPLYFLFHGANLVYASFDLEDGKRFAKKNFPKGEVHPRSLKPDQTKALDAYFLGKELIWKWPLELYGTTFQKQVWVEVQKIPQGQVSTYKDIATNLETKAFQAVGQAVGANPISIIIPCHRVLGTDWFGGYAGGLNRKRLLLELENVTLAPNFNA